ncbi:MAG: outer membrane lipoprotein-sorting protein [Acidobacteriia bacterium]|nr:outer membrane lipoprotein-sorting protein [Terriglobia bacterium]
MNSTAARDAKILVPMLALSVYVVVCFSSRFSVSGSPLDPRKIMEDVYQQDTSHDTAMRANLEVFDKEGHGKKKRFSYRRIGSLGDSKTLVVFTDPKEIRGVALLSINRRGVTDRQFMYTPATQRVRSVSAQERSARFIGSDFTYEDIAEHVLDDFTYRLLGDGENIDGHKTYKVEATPVDPGRSQYKFLYYWVAQDVPVILFAEMYDANGRKVRVLHATQLKRESGIWGARHTEMSSVQDATRTVLTIDEVKFNTGLDEKLFTPEGLEEIHPSQN